MFSFLRVLLGLKIISNYAKTLETIMRRFFFPPPEKERILS